MPPPIQLPNPLNLCNLKVLLAGANLPVAPTPCVVDPLQYSGMIAQEFRAMAFPNGALAAGMTSVPAGISMTNNSCYNARLIIMAAVNAGGLQLGASSSIEYHIRTVINGGPDTGFLEVRHNNPTAAPITASYQGHVGRSVYGPVVAPGGVVTVDPYFWIVGIVGTASNPNFVPADMYAYLLRTI